MSGPGEEFFFLGLDPRKTKRRVINSLLKPLGDLSWRRLPPLALRAYPETTVRATEAYTAARRPARWAPAAWLQRCLYAWQYNGTRAWFTAHPDHVAVAWNGLNGSRRVFMDGARDAGARRLFFELSPFKGRITCDPMGVNQANGLPRSAAFYLDWMQRTGVAHDTWRGHRAKIVQRAPSRAKSPGMGEAGQGGPYIFAPLQVPGDSQLRIFGGTFRTVPDFIDALVAAADHLPDGWHLKIKEHPTAEISFAQEIASRSPRVILDNQTDTFALVGNAAAVITVNSSVGLEAMFFEKPVIACGECFWAIPGIADHAPDLGAMTPLFARPEALGFDPAARAAFLNYLLDQYYLVTDDSDPGRAQKIMAQLRKDAR